MGRRKSKNRTERRWVTAERFRVADEVRAIQRRAAEHDGRVVRIGPLVLFSTDPGDAWVLDPAEQLATRLAPTALRGTPAPIATESQAA